MATRIKDPMENDIFSLTGPGRGAQEKLSYGVIGP